MKKRVFQIYGREPDGEVVSYDEVHTTESQAITHVRRLAQREWDCNERDRFIALELRRRDLVIEVASVAEEQTETPT